MDYISNFEYIIRFFVTSATSLLLVFVVLGVRFPSGRKYARLRIAKYMACLSFFLSGFQIFFWSLFVHSTPLMVAFRYLIDSLSYALLLAVPVIILSVKSDYNRVRKFVGLLLLLCVSLQVFFQLSYPLFGWSHPVLKWMTGCVSVGILFYLLVYYIQFCAGLRKQGVFIRYWLNLFYIFILLSFLYFQFLLLLSDVLYDFSLWPTVLFILFNVWFVIKLYDYAYQQRLADSIQGGLLIRTDEEKSMDVGKVNTAEMEDKSSSGIDVRDMNTEVQKSLQKALEEWIQKKKFLEQDEGIENVVCELGTDLQTFRQYFRTNMRVDFRTWRIALRIEYAKECLQRNPDISINRLSEMAGFATRSNFYHYFKRITGITPAEYREHLLEEQK